MAEPHAPLLERLGMFALYGVLGALVGALGSLTHRARIDVLGVTIWFGIVVAIACVLALTIGVRISSRDRGVPIAFATGFLLALVGFAVGYSHSVVIVGDLVGLVWLVGSALIVGAGIAWPRLAPSRREYADGRAADAAGGSPVAAAPSNFAEAPHSVHHDKEH